jgi:hypothetical protein
MNCVMLSGQTGLAIPTLMDGGAPLFMTMATIV